LSNQKREENMTTIYLAAIAFGVTLLLGSMVLGGKDIGHDGSHHGDAGLAWAPVLSLRFWVFLLAFGGGAGYALVKLGSTQVVAAIGALSVGWIAGALAVAVVAHLKNTSVSSEVAANELVGVTGTLVLPVGPGKPGKVRIDVKGRSEDFVASLVEDGAELPAGATVLIVAEGEPGSLLVAKGEM
jgi:hypothetical protein